MFSLDADERRLDSAKNGNTSNASTAKNSLGSKIRDLNHHDYLNKENLPAGNLAIPTNAEVGQSRAYLMAMKALQQKLDEKDLRIRQLENLLQEATNGSYAENRINERNTANFGQGDRHRRTDGRDEILKVKVQPLNLDQTLTKGTEEETNITCSDGISMFKPGFKKATCACSEMDLVQARLDEALRELDLTSKKLANSKEQCSRLQDTLDQANRQIAGLEGSIHSKDKEIVYMSGALKNMKELIDIISKKRKDGQIEDFTSLESLNSIKSEVQRNEFTLSKQPTDTYYGYDGNSCPTCGNQWNKLKQETVQQASPTFEGVISDIVGHILLNPELSMDEIELFGCLRDRLLDFDGPFRLLSDNYAYLKKTKNLLVERSTVRLALPRIAKN